MTGNPYLRFPFQSFQINASILWVVFALFVVAYAILSAVLVYHWRVYGMHTRAVVLAEVTFFVVSALLFMSAIVSIGTF